MAEIFLPGFAKVILNVPPFRRFFMKRIAPSGIYEYVIARTKLFDSVFLDALKINFPQIVLLGAGMDTRALRFQAKNTSTRIFELDIPKTQKPKIEILNRKGVALPEELVFIPIDFNKQSLSEAMFPAGFEADRKTLFLWEGVTMYLASEAVDSTLSFIQENCAQGSRVVFDYIYGSVLRQENKYYGEQEIFNRVSQAGEGWTFGIEESEIEPFLSERGFKMNAHYTPSELEKKFLTGEEMISPRPINGTHCNVVASVQK